ncbi:PHP domain-containing protein [Xylanibacillus composti]|uniref:Histidinol-phosphatase n=1 Tax=Xylanibacillus composti TaxID=1572762 RepID=A0A8J4M143_9BACL|nr:histidinol-phosphatase [Xylanibacillus composti]MDT9723488.1 PHP domain-containing protein [Xylanibacillus composti]GIQ68475.1 putative histidinol-phosphatase [Xylanibacillus composti]
MKFDLHTHNERCGHAIGTIEDYVVSAIRKGLHVIGISDHSPYFAEEADHHFPQIAMAKSMFAAYVEEVLRLKAKYAGQIEVLLGVESDYFPESAHLYQEVYDRYPFDYLIGSIHHVEGVSIFNKKRWGKLDERRKIEVKEAYYDLIEQSARSGMFDILGHIDAMKAFYPAFSDIPTGRVDQTLQVIAETGVAIEINTSGKTKAVGGWYPSDDILERACRYGVSVTFGSDAHDPDRVADEWELVRDRLKDIGFREWVYVSGRKPHRVPL